MSHVNVALLAANVPELEVKFVIFFRLEFFGAEFDTNCGLVGAHEALVYIIFIFVFSKYLVMNEIVFCHKIFLNERIESN
ncbi:hypothetical protein BpHYR1_048865 [Brachionus plicatilis]|uniref:Uncharacterized protein n=1 Tax=Brachionus plicatilis TaxID=10195 RepID=A0A3M7PHR8_BRAPC|nr:hypothetical protein BpHYR1_048865 [Brachionus plicatilis]